ncbi:MAG: MaoC family dehydratase [Deinococcota bacterium]|jgi:acyl dehydratase|nr:MaoC family dehydratase [Deinococcota bacterium]
MTTFKTVDELKAAVGLELGPGPWLDIDQERVNRFAEVTGDAQWLHVDPERARAESPFGGTVAHGFLTLSLLSALLMELLTVEEAGSIVNYGFNRVRLPAPVLVGSRLRLWLRVAEVTVVAGGVQVSFAVTLENDRQERPACAAELLFRYYR